MPLNVLVADDSRVARAVILRILRLIDIDLGETHEATNGREALQIVRSHPLDLVCLDINMPEMNGEEVVEAIRENTAWAELPIVVISTEGSETRVEHLRTMGARFIHKPYTPETVRQVVLELVGGGHARQS